MAKKAKKSEEDCPGCGKRADSVDTFARGFYRATHGFKMVKVRSAATGKLIECQVADRICTNIIPTTIEPDRKAPEFTEEDL